MEAIIGIIGLGLIIPILGWMAKTLYDLNAKLSARISADDEKWNKNTEDHIRAFGEIKTVEDIGRENSEKLDEVERKVDILIDREERAL